LIKFVRDEVVMATTNTPPRLTSLLLVEERLAEADFFARRFAKSQPGLASYFLNAFLSSARSVTFLLQKEMAHVDGFAAWWAGQRAAMGGDKVARFFLELRNFSQKQGRVSLVSSGTGRPGSRSWTFRFVGTETSVPQDLLGVDAGEACVGHVAKLARVVLACMKEFPFHSCPSKALTVEGAQALGLEARSTFEALGYPYLTGNDELAWRFLGKQVDAVDIKLLEKFANARLRRRSPLFNETPSGQLSAQVLGVLERRLLKPASLVDMRVAFIEILLSNGPDE